MNIRESVIAALREAADPVRAPQQQAYMKADMPFFGVSVPQCRRIAGSAFKAHPLPDGRAWEAAILDLWRKAAHREERYAAVELLLLRRCSSWLEPVRIPMIEELVGANARLSNLSRREALRNLERANVATCPSATRQTFE